MDQNSEDKREVIKVIIVNEDGTESEIDPSVLNCIKLEISHTDDACIEPEQEKEYSYEVDDIEEDALLDNIKVEVIEDPEQEFSEYVLSQDEEYSDADNYQHFEENEKDRYRKRKRGRPANLESNKRKVHTCDICGYKSYQKSHYRRHLTIHSKPDGIQCSICRKQMLAKAELTDHMEEHRCSYYRDRFQCNICSYTSKKLTNVSQHTEIHYKPEKIKFNCENCDFSTTNESLFKKHLGVHKNSRRSLRCPVCLITFKTMALRRKHIQIYRSVEDPCKFQCPECSYNTVKFNNFKQHMVVHRSEYEIEMFLCSYCPFKSKRKSDLRQHVIVKHKTNEEVVLFKCDFCSYESRRGNHLTSHMKNRHSREIVMKKCGLCSYKTVSQVLIEKHYNIHSKVPEHFFLCSICGMGFWSSKLLEGHVENSHLNDDEPVDPFADDDYVIKKEVGIGEVGYFTEICQVSKEDDNGIREEEMCMFCCKFPHCKFKTPTEKDAKIHKTISHNRRGDDNRCPECTFHTTSRYIYLDHLKVHKIDIEHLKPLLCDICGTRWIRQGDLTRHMSVHWGSETEKRKKPPTKKENPDSDKQLLECSHCSYTTKLRLCMYKHMQKHGEEYQWNDGYDEYDYDEDFMEEPKYEESDEFYDHENLFNVLKYY